MGELKWVGPPGTGGALEIPTVSDVNTKKGTALTAAQIDTQISSGLTGYATKSYTDTQDATKALKSYVDSQDATKMLRSIRGVANGAIPLDANGLIPKANITNVYPTGYMAARWGYSPASYSSDAATNVDLTVQDQVKLCSDIVIPDPGYPYKLLPYGYWECWCVANTAQAWPEVRVKVGTDVIGWGRGAWNVTEGHPCQVVPYDPNDRFFTGSVTVTTWGGRNRWGTASTAVRISSSQTVTPAKLIIVQVASAV